MAGQAEPLTSWRGCALYAKSLLEHARLDPHLQPHLQAFLTAVGQLLAQDASRQSPPAIPPASPWAQSTPQAMPHGEAYSPAPAPTYAQYAAPGYPPPPAAIPMTPMPMQPIAQGMPQPVIQASGYPAHAAPEPAVATQAEPPMGPMQVFTFGSNDKGVLGHGVQRPPGWEVVREVAIEGAQIIGAANLKTNCVFIDRSGQLFLTGSNASYLHTDQVSRGRELPVAVAALRGRVASRIFFGGTAAHLFAVIDGRLHTWGSQVAALGIDTRAQVHQPVPVPRIGGVSTGGGVPGERVRRMALSHGHTLVVMDDGALLATGSNSRGQLGMGAKGSPYEVHAFASPDDLAGARFQAIAGASLHSAAVSQQGELFTSGRNDAGELGHEATGDRYRFSRVVAGSILGRAVAQVGCGEESTLCVTTDGRLHSAGSNSRGALGAGDMPGTRTFVEIPLEGRTVRQLAMGAHHAIVLCHDGSVLAWGDNNQGQVTGADRGGMVKTPKVVTFFQGRNVIGVGAGEAHSMVMVGAQ